MLSKLATFPSIPSIFFQNCRSWHYLHFCITSNGNKLVIVANQWIWIEIYIYQRVTELKLMSLKTSSNSFSYLSNMKMSAIKFWSFEEPLLSLLIWFMNFTHMIVYSSVSLNSRNTAYCVQSNEVTSSFYFQIWSIRLYSVICKIPLEIIHNWTNIIIPIVIRIFYPIKCS